jgi:hypothetical protein
MGSASVDHFFIASLLLINVTLLNVCQRLRFLAVARFAPVIIKSIIVASFITNWFLKHGFVFLLRSLYKF